MGILLVDYLGDATSRTFPRESEARAGPILPFYRILCPSIFGLVAMLGVEDEFVYLLDVYLVLSAHIDEAQHI